MKVLRLQAVRVAIYGQALANSLQSNLLINL